MPRDHLFTAVVLLFIALIGAGLIGQAVNSMFQRVYFCADTTEGRQCIDIGPR